MEGDALVRIDDAGMGLVAMTTKDEQVADDVINSADLGKLALVTGGPAESTGSAAATQVGDTPDTL